MADLLVVDENVPVGEENLLVVLAAADQLNIHGAGGSHVVTDVQEILEEPEQAEGHAGDFAAEEKNAGQREGDDKFEKRAAKDHQRVPGADFVRAGKDAKKGMAGFVNREIDPVEEEKLAMAGKCVKKEESVQGQREPSCGTEDGFPVVDRDTFEKG